MIRTFKGRVAEAIIAGERPRGFPSELLAGANRRLQAVHNAVELTDLRSPPGNRLEALSGNRTGQHSIRINDKWRICFRWTEEGAEEVEIVDYH